MGQDDEASVAEQPSMALVCSQKTPDQILAEQWQERRAGLYQFFKGLDVQRQRGVYMVFDHLVGAVCHRVRQQNSGGGDLKELLKGLKEKAEEEEQAILQGEAEVPESLKTTLSLLLHANKIKKVMPVLQGLVAWGLVRAGVATSCSSWADAEGWKHATTLHANLAEVCPGGSVPEGRTLMDIVVLAIQNRNEGLQLPDTEAGEDSQDSQFLLGDALQGYVRDRKRKLEEEGGNLSRRVRGSAKGADQSWEALAFLLPKSSKPPPTEPAEEKKSSGSGAEDMVSSEGGE